MHDYAISTVLICRSQWGTLLAPFFRELRPACLFLWGGKSHGVLQPMIPGPQPGSHSIFCILMAQNSLPNDPSQLPSSEWAFPPVCLLSAPLSSRSSQLEAICRRRICKKSAGGVKC